MKTIISENDTVIEHEWIPVYENGMKVENGEGLIKHKQSIREIYFFNPNYDQNGYKTQEYTRVSITESYLREVLKKIDDIRAQEPQYSHDNSLPF